MSDPQTVQRNKLIAILPGIIKSVDYSELYGYDLSTITEIPNGATIRNTLLDKFLVANKYDVDQASFQLQKTLFWRKTFNPLSAAFLETHDQVFQDMGVITSVPFAEAFKEALAPKQVAASAPAATKTKSSGSSESSSDEEEVVEPKHAPEAEDDPIGLESNVPATITSEPVATPTTETTTDATTAAKPTTTATATFEPSSSVKEASVVDNKVSAEPPSAEDSTSHATLSKAGSELSPSNISAGNTPSNNLIVTWNLYGEVQNREKVFKNLDAFIRWRVGLMERGIAALDFTNPRTSYMDQVHNYSNVMFFLWDSSTREASKAVVEIFSDYYPEFPNLKYFVNVPRVMSWVFSFVKTFLPKATVDKFRVITKGKDFALQTGNLWVPIEYGGQAESLKSIELTSSGPRETSLLRTFDAELAKEKFNPKPIPAPVPSEFTSGPTEDPAQVASEPIPDVPASVGEEVLETGKPEIVIDGHGTQVDSAPAPQPVARPTPTTTATATTSSGVDKDSPAAPQPGAVPELPATKTADAAGTEAESAKGIVSDAEAYEKPIITAGPATTTAAAGGEVSNVTTAAVKEVEPKTAI